MMSIKKLFNQVIILFFIYCFSYCICIFLKPYVLPPLDLENTIEISIGYVNSKHESFDVYFSDDNNPSISNSFGEEGYTQTLFLFVPCVNARDLKFVFGNDGNIARIDRILINGKEIPLENLYDSLYRQNFKVGKSNANDSIYLVSKGKSEAYNFEFEDKLQYITYDEYNLLQESEETMSLYLLAGSFFLGLLIYVISNHYIKSSIRKNLFGFVLSLILLIILVHSFCFIIGYRFIVGLEDAPDHFLNFLKYESNLLPLILFGFLPFVASFLIKKNLFKILLIICSLLFIVILGVDNFVTTTFLTRFMFTGATGFLVDVNTAIPFFLSYVDRTNGFLAIVTVVVFVACSLKYYSSSIKNVVIYSYFTICSLSLIFAFWPFEHSDFDIYFANVFQINHLTTNSMGNYNREYSDDYPYRQNLDLDWQERQGLGLRKNVIIILAESLSCDLTKMCGTGADKELAPNLSALAKEFSFFNNYYSDSYATSMAVLTIVKSFPAFPERNPSSIAKNKYIIDLMNQNDLVTAFSENGYKTAFFSSTELIFLMDRILDFTHFDQIYDSSSDIFDEKEKKFIFNSVSDEVLFSAITKFVSAQPRDQKLFLMTKTAGSHVPFDSPWGAGNFDNAFLYSDHAINEFIKSLEKINYFENGIVVITGDHQPWGYSSTKANRGLFDKNQVPLIIIDKTKKHEVNNTMFSHSSLGIYLQSLMLDKYKFNRFNADPLNTSELPLMLVYELDRHVFALVKKGDKETRIKFDGDDTEFSEHIFDPEYEHDVLGYLATCGL